MQYLNRYDHHIFDNIDKNIEIIYYQGNHELLKQPKVSIVGTRRPMTYTKNFTSSLAKGLNQRGQIIVSGCAMGVDALAHKACENFQTIGVVANGLDIRYPKINQGLIQNIEQKGLMLSFFEKGHEARPYNFVQRNELVVALSDALIITQADLNSGTLSSANFAIKQGKPIYVLPHRLNESLGTQKLLKEGHAKAIDDMDGFLNQFGSIQTFRDDLIEFCQQHPLYETALQKFGARIFEYELAGKIEVKRGRVLPL